MMAVSSQTSIPTLSSPSLTSTYPSPVGGASLLLAFKPTRQQTILVIGAGLLAAIRAFAAIEAGFHVVVAYDEGFSPCGEVQWRAHQKQLDLVVVPKGETEQEQIERLLEIECVRNLSLACITDTLIPYTPTQDSLGHQYKPRSFESVKTISKLCRIRNVPINVADMPSWCDFTFPATHRFTTTTTTISTSAIAPNTSLTPSDEHGESQPSSSTASSSITVESGAGGTNAGNGGVVVAAAAYQRPTSLQFAITTNGQACRLASRLKREVVSALPKDVGSAVDNVGDMRRMLGARSSISAQQQLSATNTHDGYGEYRSPPPPPSAPDNLLPSGGEEEEDVSAVTPPVNAPVAQDNGRGSEEESSEERRRRRMRWIAQMSEYWPLERLASLSKLDMEEALLKTRAVAAEEERDVPKRSCPKRRPQADDDSHQHHHNSEAATDEPVRTTASSGVNSRHGITLDHDKPVLPTKGRILLVGSGPGHPSLLTVAARKALTETGTLILSDKLVPTQVLDLIPKSKKLYIAKKYPGNAEGAQNELMDMALDAALKGETVVRLKQGDPFLYGRGGEEVLFFRAHGFEPLVIPGVSSALAGPLLAGIPVTQRGVAESLTVCTGVGRKGRDVDLPGYERSRTLVILMGVARLSQLVAALTEGSECNGPLEKESDETVRTRRRRGAAYPGWTPIAIIERASCPDQRVLVSTLDDVEEGLTRLGEQRPPGMIVVGWAAVSLAGSGDLGVLDDANDSRQAGGQETSVSGNDDTEVNKAVVGDGPTQGNCGAAESLSAKDKARVSRWLGGERWRVCDGLPNSGTWNLFS